MRASVFLISAFFATGPVLAQELGIRNVQVDDRKAVIATVEPVRQLVARARIGGTVLRLNVKEGDRVAAGAALANVADQKLALQMQALDQRIKSQQAQRDQAKSDFERINELLRRGVSTQTQADQARTGLDIAERTLSAMRSDREVIVQQSNEGAVLAPGAGRVLSVPVSEGRVVMPGETIATLAEDKYILRLSLPERHARSMRAGDVVAIGARENGGAPGDVAKQGKIRLVYPEIQGGRVMADVDVEGLGDYFVGERVRVYVLTGKRDTVLLPADYLLKRAGLTLVRLKGGGEIVVQTGEARSDGVEILSGLNSGDVVVKP